MTTVQVVRGTFLGGKRCSQGDVVECTEAEARALIAMGKAVAYEKPKPKSKRVVKKNG